MSSQRWKVCKFTSSIIDAGADGDTKEGRGEEKLKVLLAADQKSTLAAQHGVRSIVMGKVQEDDIALQENF